MKDASFISAWNPDMLKLYTQDMDTPDLHMHSYWIEPLTRDFCATVNLNSITVLNC